MALSSRKCCPTQALHIGARKSSTVSSLFTVCRPERTMLGPNLVPRLPPPTRNECVKSGREPGI